MHFNLSRVNPPPSDAPDAGIISPVSSFLNQLSPFEIPVSRATDHENAYNFGHTRRGLCVIINNVEFDREMDLGDRSGSDADANGLEKQFQNLGFQVRKYRNARVKEMLAYLREGTLINGEIMFCSILQCTLTVYIGTIFN